MGTFIALNFHIFVDKEIDQPTYLQIKHAQCIFYFITWMEENPNFIEQALTHDVLTQL